MQTNGSVTMLDINLIIPNKYQPRKVFDEKALNTLAESIKTYGIINPILVRKKEDKYEIIAGERRFRAAKQIGLKEIPAIIKNADEQQMAELALIENLERQSLSPIEEAKSYEEIMRIGNHTQENLAKKIGKSQGAIANKIRLLSLPEEIQDALANKKISERHARSLINVKNETKQIELLNRIMTEKLTVKETEEIINSQEKEIDEDEIKQAISDIMKSLNIKEEEKEDDNMNNGNFFPNFDNNNAMNNNTSLNMMNMQSMNQPAMEPVQETVMPTMAPPMNDTFNPMPQPEQNINAFQPAMEQNPAPMQPTPDVNMNNDFNPIPNFIQPTMEQTSAAPQPSTIPTFGIPQPSVEQPMINNVPTFGPTPMEPVQPATSQPEINIPMEDVPLFNPNAVMPTADAPMTEPVAPVEAPVMEPVQTPVVEEPTLLAPNSFEIPVVNTEPEVAPAMPVESTSVEQDRLAQLQELLTANGYTFKTFSNDTENCIIIELPRN